MNSKNEGRQQRNWAKLEGIACVLYICNVELFQEVEDNTNTNIPAKLWRNIHSQICILYEGHQEGFIPMILKYVHARQKPGYFSPPKHARTQTNDARQCKRLVAWIRPEYDVIVQGKVVVLLRQTLANCSFVSDDRNTKTNKDEVRRRTRWQILKRARLQRSKMLTINLFSILNARRRQPQKAICDSSSPSQANYVHSLITKWHCSFPLTEFHQLFSCFSPPKYQQKTRIQWRETPDTIAENSRQWHINHRRSHQSQKTKLTIHRYWDQHQWVVIQCPAQAISQM